MTEFRFAIRVRPGARADAAGGRWEGRNGVALLVSVTAPAVDGKANDAVRRVLAAALDVRGSQISVLVGARGRDKIIAVSSAAPDLAARVTRLIGASTTG